MTTEMPNYAKAIAPPQEDGSWRDPQRDRLEASLQENLGKTAPTPSSEVTYLQAFGKIAKGALSLLFKTVSFAITQIGNAAVAATLLYMANNLTVDINVGFNSAEAGAVEQSLRPQPRP